MTAGSIARPGELIQGDVASKSLQVEEDGASMFERWARDPAIDVEKFERFMAMWERERARRAESAFDTAMNEAQKQIRPVAADSHNSQTHSDYASYEALDRKIRPIYTGQGFGLSFDTGDAPHENEVRVLCYVSHSGGHKRTYRIDMPADGKGAKGGDVMTRTHATGAAVTYGQRYLLKMIFNIAIGEKDDDGNRAGRVTPVAAAPEGYGAWFANLDGLASQGEAKFEQGWSKSPESFRKHLSKTEPKTLAALKTAARKAGK